MCFFCQQAFVGSVYLSSLNTYCVYDSFAHLLCHVQIVVKLVDNHGKLLLNRSMLNASGRNKRHRYKLHQVERVESNHQKCIS